MIRFGPAGNSRAFYAAGNKSSTQAPAWLASVGLNAYEYSFGRGVTMKRDTALAIGAEARAHDIAVSVHAPYFVNFASVEDAKVENSFRYVLDSLALLDAMGGTRCVVHVGACTKLKREDALALCRDRLLELDARMRAAGFAHLRVCPETMGRFSQIGSPAEIVDLCALSELFVPCFDFGHINCLLQGALTSAEAYKPILGYAFEHLPAETVRALHVHFSHIAYNGKGEIRHLDFTDTVYGPAFEPFCEAIDAYGLEPTVICESSEVMAEDAMQMHAIWSANRAK